MNAPTPNLPGEREAEAVSGGAPLSATIARCFLGLDVPIVQGYGMTETSPVVSVNAVDDNDPATGIGAPPYRAQCAISTGTVMLVSTVRVTPPSMRSAQRG